MPKTEPDAGETVSGYYVKICHAGSGGVVLSDAVITEYADVALLKALARLDDIMLPRGTHLKGAFVVHLTPTELTILA